MLGHPSSTSKGFTTAPPSLPPSLSWTGSQEWLKPIWYLGQSSHEGEHRGRVVTLGRGSGKGFWMGVGEEFEQASRTGSNESEHLG